MTDIILRWVIPIVLSGIIGMISKQFKDSKAIRESMIALLRSQIVGLVDTYMKMGCLPDYGRYTLTELSRNYTTLKANHGIQKLVEQCLCLPPTKVTRTKKEKK